MRKEISAKCILKTAPENLYGRTTNLKSEFGLITVQIETPLYVWMELLTHKRPSRNASSNRAMPPQVNLNLGYFMPKNFHYKSKGMQSGEIVSEEIQKLAEIGWVEVWEFCKAKVLEFDSWGITKEESSRLLPTFKIMNGLVTATKDAWDCLLDLRTAKNADKAMQELANKIKKSIQEKEWNYSYLHQPFLLEEEKSLPDSGYLAAGRIARLSYGDIKNKDGDIELGKRLLNDGHFSCFEHSAEWVEEPLLSNLSSKPEDKYSDEYGYNYGWQNIRSKLEETLDKNID